MTAPERRHWLREREWLDLGDRAVHLASENAGITAAVVRGLDGDGWSWLWRSESLELGAMGEMELIARVNLALDGLRFELHKRAWKETERGEIWADVSPILPSVLAPDKGLGYVFAEALGNNLREGWEHLQWACEHLDALLRSQRQAWKTIQEIELPGA